MLITAWLFLLAAYPSFWLMVAFPSLATAIFAVGFLNLIKAGYSGVLPSVLSEQFPVETRAVGVAFSFSVSVTIFGAHQQLVDWGWRVPYVFGLLVGPAGLYIRSRIAETPEFLNAEKPQRMPISELLRQQPVSVVLALGAAVISNSSYYLLLYIPTYGVKTLHLPAYTTFAATLIGGIILAVFSVIAGYYSDRTKPRTQLMLITAWLFLLTAYPSFWLMVTFPSLATAIFAVGFLNLIKAGYSGVLPSVLSEQFPVETRAVGVAFSFSVSVTIFGGFAPFTATWLIAQTGDPLSPAYYLMVTALLSIIALMVIARRGPADGRSLRRQ